MDNLQKLLDERWTLRETDKEDAFLKKSALRDAFVQGYNARIAEENGKEDAIRYALNIVDLWGVSQKGTVTADHEGEMQALSQMESKLKEALNL